MTITFTSKAEYLVWRSEWKRQYGELSEEIRKQKRLRTEKEVLVRGLAQCRCYLMRKQAREMMELRKKSKEEAQRQYQAAHAVAA